MERLRLLVYSGILVAALAATVVLYLYGQQQAAGVTFGVVTFAMGALNPLGKAGASDERDLDGQPAGRPKLDGGFILLRPMIALSAVGLALLGAALIWPSSGCATMKAAAKTGAKIVFDCTLPATDDMLVNDLTPAVQHIVTEGIDVTPRLDSLRKVGDNILACAVQKVIYYVTNALTPKSLGAAASPEAMAAAARAQGYLDGHGWEILKSGGASTAY